MLPQYKKKGDNLTIIGFIVHIGALYFLGGSVLGQLLGFVGLIVFTVGCTFLAKAKGHNGAWGLFGLLSLIGYFILLACLRDKAK